MHGVQDVALWIEGMVENQMEHHMNNFISKLAHLPQQVLGIPSMTPCRTSG